MAFVWRNQEADGSWFGRWGVNYIYGTSHVLRGLALIGEDMAQPRVLRARDWLEKMQNPDGGWGESCWTYHDPATRGGTAASTFDGEGQPLKSGRGEAPSTASQTAWALLGLLACGDYQRESVTRGIKYLLDTQNPDGSWHYPWFTGTGFPRIFYLKYTSYQWAWPLLALSWYRNLSEGKKLPN